MQSYPPYPLTYIGPVLVCGNAWCLLEDIRAARQIMRLEYAPVIGVNGSSAHVRMQFLFSRHPQHLKKWRDKQATRGHEFTVHCGGDAGDAPRFPWVDYWWKDVGGQGTSTWSARKLARHLGFSEVILCGMPLEPGGYCRNPMTKHFRQQPKIDWYREGVKKDEAWHDGVCSMSGWTREFFGAPSC